MTLFLPEKGIKGYFDRDEWATRRQIEMNLFGKSKKLLSYDKKSNIEYRLKTGEPFFQKELCQFLCVDKEWVKETFREYAETPEAWIRLSSYQSPSSQYDGKAKSLDIAEGFAVWSFVKMFRPKNVVELGSQFGISARLWKEALQRYVPQHSLHLFDLEDKRQYITDQEATLHLGDAYRLFPEFLKSNKVDLLINDAHPYELIKWSLFEAIQKKVPYFAFHDVGNRTKRGPFRKNYFHLSEYDKLKGSLNWGKYGHWERHVMADVFDRKIADQKFTENKNVRVQIFDSLFGYGFVIDKTVGS